MNYVNNRKIYLEMDLDLKVWEKYMYNSSKETVMLP